jgi:hypothetical protein
MITRLSPDQLQQIIYEKSPEEAAAWLRETPDGQDAVDTLRVFIHPLSMMDGFDAKWKQAMKPTNIRWFLNHNHKTEKNPDDFAHRCPDYYGRVYVLDHYVKPQKAKSATQWICDWIKKSMLIVYNPEG